MAANRKYTGLGRGLDALITTDEVKTGGSSSINEIPLTQIHPNPNQPRRDFDETALQELSDSVRMYGIIQPITLRRTGTDSYQIIAGERRWRAAGMAGLATVPAYVRDVDDRHVLELALEENIQRSDLNPMEIALTYKGIMEEENLTQDKLSERVGKNRTTIANYLRLFKLPAEVQLALQERTIDMGHARALLALDSPVQQLDLYHRISQEGLSVRKVEELAKAMNGDDAPKAKAPKKKEAAAAGADFSLLKQHLATYFKTDVQLTCNAKGKGKISIPFKNEKELERIMALLDSIRND